VIAGLRLALTTFTVLPLRGGRVDRAAAGTAMALAPLVGAVLGAALGGLALGLGALGTPALVAAALVVAAELLATRGLHVDGLADTVDGLGSYRGAERALAIMRSPEVGPFGVAAIALDLLLRTGCVAVLVHRGWTAVLVLACATATGRLAVSWACRPGAPAARADGLGALVAGSTPRWTLALGTLAVAALALPAVPHRPWQGPLAVLVALVLAESLRRHVTRRLGGITGDVLGALVELAAVTTLIIQVSAPLG
jgi:adenosylcobinamide-GDP ribazoletransferase